MVHDDQVSSHEEMSMVIREMLLAVASRRNENLQISGFQNISAATECGL